MPSYHMNKSRALDWVTKLRVGDKIILHSSNEQKVVEVKKVTPAQYVGVSLYGSIHLFYPDGYCRSKNYKGCYLEEWTAEKEHELIVEQAKLLRNLKANYILRELYDHRNRGWLTDEVIQCINDVLLNYLPEDVLKGTMWEEIKNEAERKADTKGQST